MAIVDHYRGIALDIDGVLMRGAAAIPGAAAALEDLRARGLPVAFVTNNARRTPEEIAGWLGAAGMPAEADAVVTSALAAAALLEPGTRCLVIGMAGLRCALEARGCTLVREPGETDAVVVGLDEDLTYDALRRATLALAQGAHFVGTNADVTLPVQGGVAWPGNGAILAALTAATGREPLIAGKPRRPLFDAAARRLGAEPRLFVGDRVETDIAGAAAAGWDTALVLTGVSTRADAETAEPPPDHVLADLRGLLA